MFLKTIAAPALFNARVDKKVTKKAIKYQKC